MVDADEDGYLLQIFTNQYKTNLVLKLFKEWEPRVCAGNFKALLSQLREQQLRGTL
jgi:4-hydroxyphenylpyruvate dioxygenase-like putative hemolysin